MNGNDLKDLHTFLAAAEEGSFTRAAARLGVSQSALSQTVRVLEERLGIRLFTRTTRSVALTEAGERLFQVVGPAVKEIEQGLELLRELSGRAAGTVRITADEFAVQSVLWPAIKRFLPQYPDIKVEISEDYTLTDIVSGRYDAGVRRGGLVSQDMIAVPIGTDIPMAVVGTPSYFETRPKPLVPEDLIEHCCINLRLPTHGGFFSWTFQKGDQIKRVKVDGQLTFNNLGSVEQATMDGFGLGYLPLQQVQPQLDKGTLIEVLRDWRQTFERYHLYYANRRQQPPALNALIQFLRTEAER